MADLARVAHGGALGSAVLMGAGALLAAAGIGTAPGGISRLFGNLVSRCKAEGLPIATAFGRRRLPLESDLGNSIWMKLVL